MVNNKAIRQALYQRLNVAPVTTLLASGSASIFHSVAPQESRYPLLVFFKTSAIQVGVFGDVPAPATNPAAPVRLIEPGFREHIWTVKGVTNATRSGEAEDIDEAAHNLLQHAVLDIRLSGEPTATVLTLSRCMHVARIGDVEYTEVVGDSQYRHCGGNYRLVIQDA